jgi:glycosyltransferase involved in cell wall biosynthesis
VIVTNPPIFPGLIAFAYARITAAAVVLDSHPSAFGAAPLARRLAAIHARLVRRAVATLVTVDELAAVIQGWGGRAEIVHEAPPAWSMQPVAHPRGRPRVLYITRFAGDEPTREVVEAARLVPGVDLHITGDLRKCPPGVRDCAPPNVTFVGFLRGEDYRRALEEADIVLVLTRHEQAVNRAAYECVYAGRPLIVSRLPAMTAAFPYAVHVDNDTAGIAEGIQAAVDRHAEMVEAVPAALALQLERWERQLDGLRRCLARRPADPPLSAGLEAAADTHRS